ncbi:hypothetical protein [Brevundimonas sp.]|uniref:hypothetical protein n=1 Tax=Brevundimonas sp. TaxID=1871086 RepID=UPI001D786612|nr:hypothetical protein [Brevundimonas sp.]MBA3999478.1 hypothetical protein [Brevundimonas sp.]
MTDHKRDDDIDAPYARKVPPEEGKPDQLDDKDRTAKDRQEDLVDEAVEETFPASDPATPKRIT